MVRGTLEQLAERPAKRQLARTGDKATDKAHKVETPGRQPAEPAAAPPVRPAELSFSW
jgi:hypothetical protein